MWGQASPSAWQGSCLVELEEHLRQCRTSWCQRGPSVVDPGRSLMQLPLHCMGKKVWEHMQHINLVWSLLFMLYADSCDTSMQLHIPCCCFGEHCLHSRKAKGSAHSCYLLCWSSSQVGNDQYLVKEVEPVVSNRPRNAASIEGQTHCSLDIVRLSS